jgi:hypothetical protein
MRTGSTLSTGPTLGAVDLQVLDEPTWRARAAAHAARVDAFVEPHLARRRDGVKHPVHDFLFTYYAQRPAQLRRWHPGYGVALAGGDPLRGYERVVCPTPTGGSASGTRPDTVAVSRAHVAAHSTLIETILHLLRATAHRPAQLGCFGLHEWAMVHRSDETRHDWPLRLGPAGTDRVVESHRIACSHFDAYRFFTPTARRLNALSPASGDRAAYEQPGCLHANMDLYKHGFRLTPMISSDLVADCFELAWHIRVLDMRASPYDLRDLGLEPVRIETTEGKQAYAAAQRSFAEDAAPLRRRLIEECERLLLASAGVGTRSD